MDRHRTYTRFAELFGRGRVLAPFLALFLMFGGAPVRAEVVVFAASSLKTVLDEITQTHGIDARIAYGGSAALARQVAQGAEADLVLLAHPEWMQWLTEQGASAPVLRPGSLCALTSNGLVLVGPRDAAPFVPQSASDLTRALAGGRLATGHLRAVPAGQYTAALLQRRGWLDALRPHLAESSNVRLALALVVRGEAPLGFVYSSDLSAEPRLRALWVPPEEDYPQVRYLAALTAGASDDATELLSLLAGASKRFAGSGFVPLPASDPERCR